MLCGIRHVVAQVHVDKIQLVSYQYHLATVASIALQKSTSALFNNFASYFLNLLTKVQQI